MGDLTGEKPLLSLRFIRPRGRRNGDDGVVVVADVVFAFADVAFAVPATPVAVALVGKRLLSCGMVRCLAEIKLTGFST
jgi:hypothetical protein